MEFYVNEDTAWLRRIVHRVINVVVVLALVWFLVYGFRAQVLASGNFVQPVLAADNVVLVNRLVYGVGKSERPDTMTFECEDREKNAKRIIGLPGEIVQIKGGYMFIDSELLGVPDELEQVSLAGRADMSIQLEEDEYFLLGDNRDSSKGSRFSSIGNVKREQIQSKIWFRIYPLLKLDLIRSKQKLQPKAGGIQEQEAYKNRSYGGMNIQWYPSHMTKTRRAMKEDIKLVDLVIELVDARVPLSSRDPDIGSLVAGKARMTPLNRSDLAGERLNAQWTAWLEAKGIHVVKIDTGNKGTLKQVQGVVQQACRDRIERDRKRDILNRLIRTMVVGIPNVGKSTFINPFTDKTCAKTGNRPDVTRGNQWIRLNKTLELLDTPGILWLGFDDQSVGLKLTLIDSINDQTPNKDELVGQCVRISKEQYPGTLLERSDLEIEDKEPIAILEDIARTRSCLMKGGELDVARASALLLDGFQAGKLGCVTLGQPRE